MEDQDDYLIYLEEYQDKQKLCLERELYQSDTEYIVTQKEEESSRRRAYDMSQIDDNF